MRWSESGSFEQFHSDAFMPRSRILYHDSAVRSERRVIVMSCLCVSLAIGDADFFSHQFFEFIRAKVNERLSIDEKARRTGDLERHEISHILLKNLDNARIVHIGFGLCYIDACIRTCLLILMACGLKTL